MPLVPLATEKSAPRSRGRWPSGVARVLSTATSAPAACAASDEPADVADVEPRVGGRLDPQQPRAVEPVELRVPAGGGGPHLDAVRLQLFPDQGQGLVAVVGQDHHVAGARLGQQYGRDRGHPGGEDRGLDLLPRRLQLADGPLQVGPGRVGAPGRRCTGRRPRRTDGSARRRPDREAWARTARGSGSPARTARVPSPMVLMSSPRLSPVCTGPLRTVPSRDGSVLVGEHHVERPGRRPR